MWTTRYHHPRLQPLDHADQGEDYVEQTIENKKKDNDDWFDRLTAQYKKNSYFVVYTKGAEADADVLDTDDVTTVSGKVTTKKTTGLTDGYNGNFTMGGTSTHWLPATTRLLLTLATSTTSIWTPTATSSALRLAATRLS